MNHAEALRSVFESADLDQLMALFDERIVWLGLADDGHGDGDAQRDHELDTHNHEQPPMCTGREEVRGVLVRTLAEGQTGYPVVLAEAGDSVVVDPRPEPPLEFPVHQAFTFRGDRVVLIQDYSDRASALAAVGR